MKIELLPDWQNRNLPCSHCGTYKSVKYIAETIVMDENLFGSKVKICLCNKCALRWMGYRGDEMNETLG